MKIIVDSVGKDFGERKILSNVNFEISSGSSLAIVGPNGSGKTTLMRIIAGLINPTNGEVSYHLNGQKIKREKIFSFIGFVGPYLELYNELTALENLQFFAKMKRLNQIDEKINSLLDQMQLKGSELDLVKNYSSGMKQRLKFIFALMSDPEILFLDEPTSNLDKDGINIVYEIMNTQKKNKILILATNDEADLKYGDRKIAVAS